VMEGISVYDKLLITADVYMSTEKNDNSLVFFALLMATSRSPR